MKITSALLWGMLAAMSLPELALGQTIDNSRIQSLAPPSRPSTTTASRPNVQTSCDPGSINYPMQQITVMAAAPAQAPWPLHQRVNWVVNLVLALVGYAAIWVALSALKKIERQTKYVEEGVAAVAATAQAALQHSQAILRSERPWITITAEPSPVLENTSTVVATNRGRGPARIIAMADRIVSAIDEAHLPSQPEYDAEEKGILSTPMILLPGESRAIRTFGLEDVNQFCTKETLKRIEAWSEKIFLYGKLTYQDLNAPVGQETHETSWCCWYIYGQKKSGLVTTSAPAFIALT